jgi:hypothetical protein
VGAGWLHRLYTGVYAVGHTDLSLHSRCLAAVLASGPGALLSHYSATWLWKLSPTQPIPIHVTTPIPRGRRAPIRIHRSSTLVEADRGLEQGIPVTSVARTLLDLAAVVRQRDLRRLLKRAEERKVFDLAAVYDVLARNKGHRGAKRLGNTIRSYEPPPFTRSDFELAFFEAVVAAGLPRPRVNYVIAGMEGSLRPAQVAEHRLFGHPDQAEAAVRAHVAAADADVGPVRADHLDDRADIADLAIVAVVVFDRLHLLRHHLPHLALIERHPRPLPRVFSRRLPR